MNSQNQNSMLSNISNYSRVPPPNDLNLNEYQQNSQSMGFTLFNQSIKNSLLLEKTDLFQQRGMQQQNIEPKDATIGFNQFQGFLQSSMQYPVKDFRTANIKKAPTFQFSQGYLNCQHQANEAEKQSNIKQDEQIQQLKPKPSRKQKQVKRGNATNHPISQLEDNILVKLQQRSQQQHSINRKSQSRIVVDKLTSSSRQNCLQNLKKIANVVYEGLQAEKVASYQAISKLMFDQLIRSKQQSRHQELQGRTRKDKLIEDMIRNRSFAQVGQMNKIQEDDEDGVGKRVKPVDNKDIKNYDLPDQHVKNIRRRLYDAINVMISANVIEKRGKGYLGLRLANRQGRRKTIKQQANSLPIQQMQSQIQQKQQNIQSKRKYRQMLITKYLTLQKHIYKNMTNHKKSQQKLQFPLIFTSLQPYATVQIQHQNDIVQISGNQRIDISCDMDVLGTLYWLQKEQIKRIEFDLEMMVRGEREGEGSGKDGQKGRKKVKLELG